MRKIILFISIWFGCVGLFANDNLGMQFIRDLMHIDGNPEVVDALGDYTRIALTDSITMEIFEQDSIVVVFTACAPQCSSHARIYNKEWELIREPQPPFTSVFPLATMDKQTGQIYWTDNEEWEY